MDLGAGSLQVSCFKDGILASSHNLKLGSIRIREILSEMEEHTTSFVGVMEDYIGNDMRTLGRLRLKNHKIRHMIVVGEEFSSIINYVSMTKNKEFLTGDQFNKIYNKLLKSNPSEIADKYGIPYELASVIVPSSIIYKKAAGFHHCGKAVGASGRYVRRFGCGLQRAGWKVCTSPRF